MTREVATIMYEVINEGKSVAELSHDWKGLQLSSKDQDKQFWAICAKAAEESRPQQSQLYAEALGQLLTDQMRMTLIYRHRMELINRHVLAVLDDLMLDNPAVPGTFASVIADAFTAPQCTDRHESCIRHLELPESAPCGIKLFALLFLAMKKKEAPLAKLTYARQVMETSFTRRYPRLAAEEIQRGLAEEGWTWN